MGLGSFRGRVVQPQIVYIRRQIQIYNRVSELGFYSHCTSYFSIAVV